LGRGKETSKEKPPRITSEDFDEKPSDRIEEEKEPEDLTVKSLSLLHPIQKEEDGQTIGRIIKLGGMKGNIQSSQ
jgi:hypothetical protein